MQPNPTAELHAAALTGSIDQVKKVLQQYQEQGLKPDRGTLAAAIKSGSVPLVRYFNEEHKLVPKSGIMEATADAKSFPMVQYLMKTYPDLRWTIDNTITWAAAKTGDLEFLKYFLNKGIRADEGTLYDAVRGGSLPMVKFLVEDYGLSDVSEAQEFAHRSGKNEIDIYLQERLDQICSNKYR